MLHWILQVTLIKWCVLDEPLLLLSLFALKVKVKVKHHQYPITYGAS